jgi:hypothetical protein
MSDDLRERVARATYEDKRARLLDAFGDTSGWPEWDRLKPTLREIEMENNDLVVALVRAEVLDEAARVAEKSWSGNYSWNDACHEIATAIRALKDKP